MSRDSTRFAVLAAAATCVVGHAAAGHEARAGTESATEKAVPAVLVVRGDASAEDAVAVAAGFREAGSLHVLGYRALPDGYAEPKSAAVVRRAKKLQAEGEKRFYALRLRPALELFTEVVDILGGDTPAGSAGAFIRGAGFKAAAELLLGERDSAAATLGRLVGAHVEVELDAGLFAPPLMTLLDEVRGKAAAGAGSIRLLHSLEWVPAYVDGLGRDVGPGGVIDGIGTGSHRVTIALSGRARWSRTIEVTSGAVAAAKATAEPLSIPGGAPVEDALEVAESLGADLAIVVDRASLDAKPHLAVTLVRPLGSGRFAAVPAGDPGAMTALARYIGGGAPGTGVLTSRAALDAVGTPPPPLRAVGLAGALLGAGLVGIGIGVGSGALNAARNANDLNEMKSFDEADAARNRALALADLATGLVVSGAVVLVAGAVLLVLFPLEGRSTKKIEVAPAPGGATLRVRF